MPDNQDPIDTSRRSPLRRLRNRPALAAVALLALGGGAGAVAMHATRPSVTMAPAAPVAIRSLSSDGIVTIRGRVAEIYGNKFILADASGRALVETGRAGWGGRLVTVGEPVTVQGRFDHGFVHAAFLVGPGNTVTALEPFGGPPHHGRGRGHGPDDGPGGPPPPGADRDGDVSPPPPPPSPLPSSSPGAASATAVPAAARQAAP